MIYEQEGIRKAESCFMQEMLPQTELVKNLNE